MRKRCSWIHDHKPWTAAEEDFLRAQRGTMTNKQMAALLPGRTPQAVQSRCTQLGIYKRDLRPEAPVTWPKRSCIRYSADDIATMRACAGEFPEAVQALHFPNRTVAAIRTKMAALRIPTWTAVNAQRGADMQVAA